MYLEYFWKPISLGTESGKMTRTQRAERVKRWSAYQGGVEGAPLNVPLGYRESHTVGSSRGSAVHQKVAQGGQEHHTTVGPGIPTPSGVQKILGLPQPSWDHLPLKSHRSWANPDHGAGGTTHVSPAGHPPP